MPARIHKWCEELIQSRVRSEEMVVSTVLWVTCGPALTTAFIWMLVSLPVERDDPVLFYSLVIGAMLLLILRIRLSRQDGRARLLSGNSPLGISNAPCNIEEFEQCLIKVWKHTGRRPTVVGSGWGFFIGRSSASDAVFTHRMKGQLLDNVHPTFLAGTELCTVENSIRTTKGNTFWSTPTMQRISIGSWLARSCHGNSGPAGQPSNCAASKVYAVNIRSLNMAQKKGEWYQYEDFQLVLDRKPGQFVIAAVEFDLRKMPLDFELQKKRCDVKKVGRNEISPGLELWLTNDAVLRVLFFGKARKIAIGVTYVHFIHGPQGNKYARRHKYQCCGEMVKHVDPHCFSAALMSLQLDACSLVCGCYERSFEAWRGVILLSAANAFSPDPSWLVFPLVALLSTTVNFEFIFVLQRFQDGKTQNPMLCVQRLCNSIFNVFETVRGRSELRIGDLSKGLIFLDCIMRPANATVMINALLPHIYNSSVALHDSKFHDASIKAAIKTNRLELKTPRVIFQMASEFPHSTYDP